jgi:LacI family repressor for deo operon, udp, cdd, tsx, nupC, and nupG
MPDPAPLPAPTSVDVARRAGVSQSAVSLVFGGKAVGRVGQQTQAAILQAARDLGYRPNSAARTLRSGRSHLIALAVPDITNPYFAGVLQGAERAAHERGYAVLLASVRDEQDWQPVILDALASRSVEGFLLCTMQPATASDQAALRGRAVLVDAAGDGFPSLQLAVAAGMHAALDHLRQLGHTRIAHLAADVAAETFHQRHRAYLAALRAAGGPVVAAYQASSPFSIDAAHLAARRLLEAPDPPTAIVCDSDVLAVGVYKAAKDLGRAIPRDLSVASFDDSIFARILDPELTTVAIPAATVGQRAVALLLEILAGGAVPAPATTSLELTIRASTAAPRHS